MREKAVLQYLRDNPRFLRRNQSELTRMLRLAERDVIDLTGKRLVSLRDEYELLLRQLQDWYGNSAENERILEFLHRLALRLVSSTPKKGETERILRLEARKTLGIKLCKLVDLERDGVALTRGDRKQLTDSLGLVRTDKTLPSLSGKVTGKGWKAFLNIPVFQGNRLRAVVVLATDNSKDFPRKAQSDYAQRLAELVASAMAKEK